MTVNPPQESAPKAASARAQLLLRVGDLEWHHGSDLAACAGIRYGARLLELKRRGYLFEERGPDASGWKSYRLETRMPGPESRERARVYLEICHLETMVVSGSVPEAAMHDLERALASAKERL